MLLDYHRRLLEQDTAIAEQKRLAAQTGGGSQQTKAITKTPISGIEGGWSAHDQMLEQVAHRQDAAASKGKSKTAARRLSSSTRQIQGSEHLSIPDAPIGKGTRPNRQVEVLREMQKADAPKQLGVGKMTLHRPMGFGPSKGAVVVA